MTKRRLPIGIQTFREVREQGCYYVDKTGYIERMLDEGKHYFLSRPRRFGKSLFQQMSNIYFTAPPGIHWGHAVGLAPAHDCSHLAAELIHARIDYKADHWVAVDTLNKPIVSSSEVAALRVKHLDCIQSVHGLATYGTDCVDKRVPGGSRRAR